MITNTTTVSIESIIFVSNEEIYMQRNIIDKRSVLYNKREQGKCLYIYLFIIMMTEDGRKNWIP